MLTLALALTGLIQATLARIEGLPKCTEVTDLPQICQKSDDEKNITFNVAPYIEIFDIPSFNEYDKSFTVFMYKLIVWHDQDYGVTGPLNKTPDFIKVPREQEHKIIRPTLMYLETFDVTKIPQFGNTYLDYFWFYNTTNSFEYAEFLKLEIGCDFYFGDFPFDTHQCDLRFFSPSFVWLSFNTTKLTQQRSELNDKVPIFTPRIPFEVSVKAIPKSLELWVADYDYFVSGITFNFKRNDIELLMATFFGPTAMFAVFSILALLIRVHNIAERFTMLLTISLISMTMYVNVQAPHNRGFSYIEIWMVSMFIPTIVAMLETGLVLFLLRSNKKKHENQFEMFDAVTFILLVAFFVLFQIFFWSMTYFTYSAQKFD